MLGFVQGKILSKTPESGQCVLVNQGVGYEVVVSPAQMETLRVGDDTALWIHTYVREDALILYGFPSDSEKRFFRLLVGVTGLGPRHALSLLAEHGAKGLAQLIVAKNNAGIAKAHGVGKKLAQRLVLELGGKVEKLDWLPVGTPVRVDTPKQELSPEEQLRGDLASALANLGYSPGQVRMSLDQVLEEEESPGFEVALKKALQELSGRPAREGL